MLFQGLERSQDHTLYNIRPVCYFLLIHSTDVYFRTHCSVPSADVGDGSILHNIQNIKQNQIKPMFKKIHVYLPTLKLILLGKGPHRWFLKHDDYANQMVGFICQSNGRVQGVCAVGNQCSKIKGYRGTFI